MPKISTVPDGIRPYTFHGVNVDERPGKEQAVGDCPFCGKEGKFYVNQETSQADCKSCGWRGNSATFLRSLWEDSGTDGIGDFAEERRLLYAATMIRWGVVKSPLTGEWLIPGYGADGKLLQLYKRVREHSGKHALYATPGIHQQLHGVPLLHPNAQTIFICEGVFDGMALWETLAHTKKGLEGKLTLTGNPKSSLLGEYGVLAVPGAQVFQPSWLPLFKDKKVVLCYDSDHPKLHCKACKKSHSTVLHKVCPDCEGELTGPEVPPVGYEATKRIALMLAGYEQPPKEIHYICWGENGYNPDQPSGLDVRDFLTGSDSSRDRVQALGVLLEKVKPIPEEVIAGRSKEGVKKGEPQLACLPCYEWKKLTTQWKKAMQWTPGLDGALCFSLACVISTETLGEQLWGKLISPPSTGKTTIAEALAVGTEFVYVSSTFTGFHSGYKADKEGTEDQSFAVRVKSKTFVIKDADTLLQNPKKSLILSQFRDMYDGVSRADWQNGLGQRKYEQRTTVILCGTSSLRQLDAAESGARFFDYTIMDEIPPGLERDVNRRVALKALRNIGVMANGRADTKQDPDMVKAKQLTGGYVNYLRKNAESLLSSVKMPDDYIDRVISMGELVAFMRARPSKVQEETVEREFSPRIVEQFVRLTICMAAVMNKKVVDEDVLRLTRKVAIDTSAGRTWEICRHLHAAKKAGLELSTLAGKTHQTEHKERDFLIFLRKLQAVEAFKAITVSHPKGIIRWRLTERLENLYRNVMEGK